MIAHFQTIVLPYSVLGYLHSLWSFLFVFFRPKNFDVSENVFKFLLFSETHSFGRFWPLYEKKTKFLSSQILVKIKINKNYIRVTCWQCQSKSPHKSNNRINGQMDGILQNIWPMSFRPFWLKLFEYILYFPKKIKTNEFRTPWTCVTSQCHSLTWWHTQEQGVLTVNNVLYALQLVISEHTLWHTL